MSKICFNLENILSENVRYLNSVGNRINSWHERLIGIERINQNIVDVEKQFVKWSLFL